MRPQRTEQAHPESSAWRPGHTGAAAAQAGSPRGARPAGGGPVGGGLVGSGPVERLAELVHELSGLLDGSMRTVNLALASHERGGAAGTNSTDRETDEMHRRLRTVRTALEQMAGMLQAAARPEAGAASTARRRWPRGGRERLTLGDAVINGVAILEPLAADHGVTLRATVDDRARELPAGPVYTLIVNGVRNAIEAIAAAARVTSSPEGGRGLPNDGADGEQRVVEIGVRLEAVASASAGAGASRGGDTRGAGEWVVVSIRDNGIGPPQPERSRRGRPGTPGFTTKPGGSGLGLAVCKDTLSRYGGRLELRSNAEDADGVTAGLRRRGATLRATYPADAGGGEGGDGR